MKIFRFVAKARSASTACLVDAMNVSEVFIRRPVATSLLMFAVALFGVLASSQPARGGPSQHRLPQRHRSRPVFPGLIRTRWPPPWPRRSNVNLLGFRGWTQWCRSVRPGTLSSLSNLTSTANWTAPRSMFKRHCRGFATVAVQDCQVLLPSTNQTPATFPSCSRAHDLHLSNVAVE